VLIDGRFEVAAAPEEVLAHLFDARLMASCIPGCESLEQSGADSYRAVVAVALAGVKARFDLQAEVTERLADGVRATIRGEEGGNASTLQAQSEVRLAPNASGGTQVDYRSEVALTGRLGRFALGMMKKKAQSLGDEFAANLQRALAAPPAVILSEAKDLHHRRDPSPAAQDDTVVATAPTVPVAAGPVPAGPAAAGPAAAGPVAAAPADTPRVSLWQRLLDWLRTRFRRASPKHP
jgi:carbon monoxide dehydrogenase subunit G